MPTEPKKPLIVISYAHADEPEKPAEGEVKWLSFVTGYLRPSIKHGAVDIWIDRRMPGGEDWEREIEQKLRACDIFILLVSPHSLSSDYVVDREIPIIRERQAKGEAVHFYPLVLTPTPKVALDLVRDKNLRPRHGKPFSDFSINERYREMNEAADEIDVIADRVAKRKRSVLVGREIYSPSEAAQAVAAYRPLRDERTLALWFEGQSRELVVSMAARALLRVLPLVTFADKVPLGPLGPDSIVLASATFRAAAMGRVVGSFPERASALRSAGDSAERVLSALRDALAAASGGGDRIVETLGAAAAAAAIARAATYVVAAPHVAAHVAAAHAVSFAVIATEGLKGPDVGRDAWREVRLDAAASAALSARQVADAPLWSDHIMPGVAAAWTELKAKFPVEQSWDVWVGWYEERLRGGSRGEVNELVFASVPFDLWDKGPGAANAWIREHLPPRPDDGQQRAEPEIKDRESLEAWLKGRSREVAVAIAARAALRVAPLAVHGLEDSTRGKIALQLADFTGAIYRANALARVSAKYPTRAKDLAHVIERAATTAAYATAYATARAAARAADAAIRASANVAARAADAADAADAAARASVRDGFVGRAARAAIWAAVEADIKSVPSRGAGAVSDLPLWPSGTPEWARTAWTNRRAALPTGQNWEVWIDWYEQRLRGGSCGEDHELAFASVPQEEWDKSPAAANAWIKAHLPKTPEPMRPAELPASLPNLDAPFAYGWTASQRVAVVAGAQNLPFYRHFSSEEDHRKALEACRVGGERLLKTLRDGRYNARPEYGEALEHYIGDLPKAAGAGNILLANDQVRILHDMFLAEAAMLPEGFASRLKSVIANQFALNAFYDLVQRHNEAVNAGNWTQPFPLDAAKGFFAAVEGNTPHWFEPQVEQGLRQVEEAEPLPAAPPEPVPGAAIGPPPLPPGTPEAQDSWKRQMATSANALWETFLQGQDMPVAQDEWRKAADQLGHHVRPIIEFLRTQEERKA